MKKYLISSAIAVAAFAGISAQVSDNDPAVMTINGVDVPLSEFNYLYHKNNSQQLVPLTFDQYVDMFVNYKLKVADARSMSLDTTQTYRAEVAKFGRDLAQPFLNDSSVTERLINEAVAHNDEDVYVSHIMLDRFDPRAEETLDSLRTEILSGNTTFDAAARRYSIDTRSAREGGSMGWVTGSGNYPWPFEKACYDTPVGQISDIVNSGFGYHLIRPEQRRPAAGVVLAEHILLFTQRRPPEDVEKAKNRIDSIYNVVRGNPDAFEDLAKEFSEDRGSAQQGGRLDWFGPGMMVQPFDSIAFAMEVGEICEPFQTDFGYHIIKKLGHKGNGTYDELRPKIEMAMSRDERAYAPIKSTINKTAAKIGAKVNPAYKQLIADRWVANHSNADSAFIAELRIDPTVIFTVDGKDFTLGQALEKSPLRPTNNPQEFREAVDRSIEVAFDNAIMEYAINELYENNPEYRNLCKEYRDGILLFDVSQQKVWDKASSDPKVLNKYFSKNKKKYSDWTAPKYKAYVIFTVNDSIDNEVQAYVNKKYGKKDITKINQQEFTADLKDRFGNSVKVERVIAAQGENPITDFLGFGAEKPENTSKHFQCYFPFAGKVISQPEEYLDVKGPVITDFQNVLDTEWITQLHKKYPVVIYNDVLDLAR